MFKKWPSIENTYREKHIAGYTDRDSHVKKVTWVLTEKLHGANIQVYFEKGKEPRVGRRNGWIGKGENFQGADVNNLIYGKTKDTILRLNMLAQRSGKTVRAFGELCGHGVNKGVDYGPDKQIIFFGLMLDDMLISTMMAIQMIGPVNFVPVLDSMPFDRMMQYSPIFKSKVFPVQGDNFAEGFVAVPANKVFLNWRDEPLLLKCKNPDFVEVQRKKRSTPTPLDDDVQDLHDTFMTYINKNRVESVFSKEGEITDPKDIGKYIRLVLADAKEDFSKDHDPQTFPGGDMRKVFNAGKEIVQLLKEYL